MRNPVIIYVFKKVGISAKKLIKNNFLNISYMNFLINKSCFYFCLAICTTPNLEFTNLVTKGFRN